MIYDLNSNVSWEKDASGNEKTYEYDSLNQLTKKILPDNIYEMAYDDYGNLVELSDSDSALSYSYEKIGKDFYVSSASVENAGMPSYTLEYSYDKRGLRTYLDSSYGTFSYNYDNGGRLTGLTNHLGENFGFTYDNANRLTSISRPGSISNFLFDKNSFVTNIVHKKNSGDIINSFSYTRDALGNRTSITTQRGIASFGYDSESQLTGVTNTEVTGDYAGEVFSYDDLGNRLLDQLGQFNYDNKSQRLTSDYKYNYLYDNNGNLTQKSEKGLTGSFVNYTYSSENQLVKIEEYKNNVLQKTSSYFYDASGRRFKKEVVDHQNSANSYTRKYQYDGQEILAELDEYNSTLAVYTHSTLRTDDVLSADIRSTKLANQEGSYFYLKDALGSIIDVADSSGNLIQHYAYSSFGKILSIEDQSGADVTQNPVIKTSYTYTNREYDAESGMYYYRARYYEPSIGRFISEDAHPGIKYAPQTNINKYVYVNNGPIVKVDPSGNFGFVAAIIISGVISGAMSAANGGDFVDGFIHGVKIGAVVTAGAFIGAAALSSLALGSLTAGVSATLAGAAASSGVAATSILIGSSLGGALAMNLYANNVLGLQGDQLVVATFFGGLGGLGVGIGGYEGAFNFKMNTSDGIGMKNDLVKSLVEIPTKTMPVTPIVVPNCNPDRQSCPEGDEFILYWE